MNAEKSSSHKSIMIFAIVGLLSWCAIMLASASLEKRDRKLHEASRYFTAQHIFQNNARVRIIEKSTYLDGNSNQENLPAHLIEENYFVQITAQFQETSQEFSNCKVSDRIHCGWMTINCYDRTRDGKTLSDLTKGITTLTFTYDPIKARICQDRQSTTMTW